MSKFPEPNKEDYVDNITLKQWWLGATDIICEWISALDLPLDRDAVNVLWEPGMGRAVNTARARFEEWFVDEVGVESFSDFERLLIIGRLKVIEEAFFLLGHALDSSPKPLHDQELTIVNTVLGAELGEEDMAQALKFFKERPIKQTKLN